MSLLALSACGDGAADRTAHAAAAGAARIACARGGAPLRRTCTVDRAPRDDGLVLTIHAADGGFRRLLVTRDGVIAADGALAARVGVADRDGIDVALGDDRYRLPATFWL